MAYSKIIPIPPRVKDIRGQKFGRLTPIGFVGFAVENNSGRQKRLAMFMCRCECGNTHVVKTTLLAKGGVRSCGCLQNEQRVKNGKDTAKHGMHKTSEYTIWSLMKYRCGNPNSDVWLHYGGRGITVCERWRDSFEAFYADMGPRPSPKHSIDRIDVNGNYEPGNVRWATYSEQANNRRTNQLVKYDGEMITIAEASRRSGLNAGAITHRARVGDLDLFRPSLRGKT